MDLFKRCAWVWLICLLGCGSKTLDASNNGNGSSKHAAYPLLTPPVAAATPAGFRSTSSTFSLSPSDFKSRFFSAGPTNIFSILRGVDSSLNGLNAQAQNSNAACLSQTPTPYTITPFGQPVTLYAQCYQQNGNALLQWAQKDGVFYLWNYGDAASTAAIATPLDANVVGDANGALDANAYVVQAWFGVGYNNATSCPNGAGWDNCSYAVLQLQADPNNQTFELSVAGLGVGYCGAQYRADASHIFGVGSIDMGSTCTSTDSICVASSDASTSATCTSAEQVFTLPALGRTQSTGHQAWAASAYPGDGNNLLTFDGTATDSLHFGPTTPTAGVGAL